MHNSMKTFKIIILLAVFSSLSVYTLPVYGEEISAYSRPWEYRLGEGLKIADTPFQLGGYLTVDYFDNTGEDGKFVFDDLSFFVFGDIGRRWRFFFEIADEHFLKIPVEVVLVVSKWLQ